MPNLPTINVPQDQLDRIIAAYAMGGTQAEAVARYKEWLRIEIRRYVTAEELTQMRAQHQLAEAQKEAEVGDALLPPTPPPDPIVP